MSTSPRYLNSLIIAFERNSNYDNAIQMERYMRNKFKFYGIKSPKRKEIYKLFKSENGIIPEGDKTEVVTWCWEASQREYQMFAMEFLGKSASDDESIISLYEYMIINKSWWDTVDFIASNLVGTYFKTYPQRIESITKSWMESGNIWLQRACLLFQLKYKTKLDTELLNHFIIPLADSKEFFIQKAIGWILREYSKTNPDFVIDYVEKNSLAPLSKREAMLWLVRKSLI